MPSSDNRYLKSEPTTAYRARPRHRFSVAVMVNGNHAEETSDAVRPDREATSRAPAETRWPDTPGLKCSAQPYVARALGDRLGEVREAMQALVASLPPEELNRVGFRLYERFRPDVPAGAEGWGAKGALRIARIHSARA